MLDPERNASAGTSRHFAPLSSVDPSSVRQKNIIVWFAQSMLHPSIRNRSRAFIHRIRPSVVRKHGCPLRPRGIAVIGISTKAQIEFVVLPHLLTIKPHSEPWAIRNADRAVLILHETAFDYIAGQMMIMSVRREAQI